MRQLVNLTPFCSARAFRTTLAAGLLVALTAAAPASAQTIPPEFLATYAELESFLDTFRAELDDMPVPPTSRPGFAVQLAMASSDRGAGVLSPYSYYGILQELDRLQALGVDTIEVSVNFPLFSPRYHSSQAELFSYLWFYKWVADTIRARHLTLVIESGTAMPQPAIRDYYQTLTFQDYVRGRIESAVIAAVVLRPDYLSIGGEPDMEALLTGQPLDDVTTSTAVIAAIVSAVRGTGVGMRIGAGVGTWQQDYENFVRSYCLNTGIDYIDFHLFPINFDFLDRALRIADIARSLGKGVSIGQAWLYKMSSAELQSGAGFVEAWDRDVYSFWTPLDGKFAEMLVRLAQVKSFEFVTPFWSRYFFTYLDYDEVKFWPRDAVTAKVLVTAAQNMINGQYTTTATRYATALQTARARAGR